MPPDLEHSNLGIDRKLVQRTAGNIDPDYKIRRRINSKVDICFTSYTRFVLNVIAGIRFEAALQVFTFKGCRTKTFNIYAKLFCYNIDYLFQYVLQIFVL